MKIFQAAVLVVACHLCSHPAFALLPLFMNFRSNDMEGTVISDSGMFQSAVPAQSRSVISPLLKRAGNCLAGFVLCGDSCISEDYTCCTEDPARWCTSLRAECCLNSETNIHFCCPSEYTCAFDPDSCSPPAPPAPPAVTIVTVTPPTPRPVTVTADPPPAPTTTVPGPPAQTITVTPPQVVLTVTQSPRTVTVTQSLGSTTVTLTSGTLTVIATT